VVVQGDSNSFGVDCDLSTSNSSASLPKFGVGIDMMIQGLFAAAAVMITFGALIGKASFDQMIVVALLETM
jgi:ammonia channel protein AmtB